MRRVHHRRDQFRGYGGGMGEVFNLGDGGTFTRASEASMLTRAPTDGSTPFLQFVGNNVRRMEDPGDGNGPRLLMEQSKTNLWVRSRELTDAAWTISGVRTAIPAILGPDGTASRVRVENTNVQLGNRMGAGIATSASSYALSVYSRSNAGVTPYAAALANGAFNQCFNGIVGTADETWTRRSAVDVVTAATYFPVVGPGCFLGNLGVNPTIPALARDHVYDLVQLELGRYPSSAIRTAAGSATRSADSLTYALGTYPDWLRSKKWSIVVEPEFTSAEGILVADNNVIFAFNDFLNTIGIWFNAGAMRVACFAQAGLTKIPYTTITWAQRFQRIKLTVDPEAGTLLVEGATTGNGLIVGTPWSWDPGTLHVGDSTAGTWKWNGRLSNPRKGG